MAVVFPTDPYEILHFNMVRAHHTFKAGHESILKNLEKSSVSSDLDNFLGYCKAWMTTIEHHHDGEDEVIFPFLSEKMDFGAEEEEHKLIHQGLADFEEVMKEIENDHAKYDPERLKAILLGMQDVLFNHLDEEAEHIKPANMKKHGFTVEEMGEMEERLNQYVQKLGETTMSIGVPFVRSHTPPEYRDIWPPIVIPQAMALENAGYWKYSPYSPA